MVIVSLKIDDLIPAEYNPRQLTQKQFEDLKKSFSNLGTLEPAVINKYKGRENVIISGHQRLRVAKDLGMTHYPCLEVEFPPKKEREADIRMNANNGEWDWDILANEFEIEDLKEWGFDEKDFGITSSENEPKINLDGDFVVEISVETEAEQQKLFEEMKKRKYKCRLLTL